ncbi:MAG TPA: hypothetical protein VFL95_10355 [Gemmatimonadales bacterium]|nr:hypothetical protein [Gemmatimonadales bacterium]
MIRGVVVLALAVAAAAPGLVGQEPPIGGCLDRQLRPVPILNTTKLSAPAAAGIADGRPVIFWNPHAQFATYAARAFTYLHECAHITLRHIWRRNPSVREQARQEIEADCWAVQMMVEGEMIHGAQRRSLFEQLALASADATHLGGADRIANLERCLAIKTDPGRWRTVLDTLATISGDGFLEAEGPPIRQAVGHQFYESTINPPGTYDCEIREGPSVVCMIFAAQSLSPVQKRYRRIAGIIRDWMGDYWTVREVGRHGHDALPRLDAQDSRTGAQVSLFASADDRLHFVFTAAQTPIVETAGMQEP